MRNPRCPKCDAPMEEGYVLDRSYGALTQSSWVEGAPKPSFWTTLSVPKGAQHSVTTFCCTKCGYLESYAELA